MKRFLHDIVLHENKREYWNHRVALLCWATTVSGSVVGFATSGEGDGRLVYPIIDAIEDGLYLD